MKTLKYFLATAALVLVVGLCFAAMAQRQPPSPFPSFPPLDTPITVVSINAIEVSDGVVGFDNLKSETAFGYTFLGRATGSYPGSFTLSMNCTPAIPEPGKESTMTGGSWTLPIYMVNTKLSNGYAGSLYGSIAKGTMVFDKKGNANVYFVLNVDGGTQSWDGVRGYASFTGTLSSDEAKGGKTLRGDLVFSILPTK